MTKLNYADTNLSMTGYTDDYQLLLTTFFLRRTLVNTVSDAAMKKWPYLSESLTNGGLIHYDTKEHLFIIL